jgi:outer membrane protein OmpA-like peptidoglycan-associated protein
MIVSGSFSQTTTSYDLRDSSLIPAKRLPQHNEFIQNAYPFPAKPRDQWEIGVKAGLFDVIGDVRSRIFTPGVGLHIRKALGYVFSIRGEYTMGWAKGMNFSPSSGYIHNKAWSGWSGPAYNPTTEPVFYNYKTRVSELSLQGVATINNIRFHRAKTGFNFYAFAGFGGMIYKTRIDAFDTRSGTYQKYNFASALAIAPTYKNRKDIRKALKNLLDGKYETHPEADPGQPSLFNEPFRPVFVFGAGMQFKISNKWNIAIEDKFSSPKTDLLDGQQWQESSQTDPAQTRDHDTYNFISVGANFNIGKKAVEPLWWINPLEYAYSEINQPKHMKLPKPILDDSDNDGVTDQFDQEPNTPAGCPVDTHGVSLDTDGDGVPDCRDKEKITPTQCQPVDADGVGKCPEPACCKELRDKLDSFDIRKKGQCDIGDLPSITFSGRSVNLSNDAKALLASVAQKMRSNPTCKVAVIGYGESSKTAQQLSWDRVNAVINYLVEKEGISSDRFIFRYGQGEGAENTVDLKDATGEEGPNTVPAPHPNLRRRG